MKPSIDNTSFQGIFPLNSACLVRSTTIPFFSFFFILQRRGRNEGKRKKERIDGCVTLQHRRGSSMCEIEREGGKNLPRRCSLFFLLVLFPRFAKRGCRVKRHLLLIHIFTMFFQCCCCCFIIYDKEYFY